MRKLASLAAGALLIFASSLAPHNPVPADSKAQAAVQVARPTVRLRKLHLVRPDLIPYPLVVEVIC